MYLDRLLLQKEPPQDTSVVWGIPNGDSVTLMIHVDGVWRPIAGSGNSSSDSSGCGCNDLEIELTGDNPININGANINKGNLQDIYSKITNGQLVNGKVFYNVEHNDVAGYAFYEIGNIGARINPNTNKPSIMIVIYSVDGNKIGKIQWSEDSVVFTKSSASGGQLG